MTGSPLAAIQVEIIPYHPSLAVHFKSLNEEWLNRYFSVTKEDLEMLEHPDKIIEQGGCILFAKAGNAIAGTCALVRDEDHSFELVKMGVTARYQGLGFGKKLLEAAIREGADRGATMIFLETAGLLKAAISLYKRAGFVVSSEEHFHPVFGRITFRMEKKLEKKSGP